MKPHPATFPREVETSPPSLPSYWPKTAVGFPSRCPTAPKGAASRSRRRQSPWSSRGHEQVRHVSGAVPCRPNRGKKSSAGCRQSDRHGNHPIGPNWASALRSRRGSLKPHLDRRVVGARRQRARRGALRASMQARRCCSSAMALCSLCAQACGRGGSARDPRWRMRPSIAALSLAAAGRRRPAGVRVAQSGARRARDPRSVGGMGGHPLACRDDDGPPTGSVFSNRRKLLDGFRSARPPLEVLGIGWLVEAACRRPGDSPEGRSGKRLARHHRQPGAFGVCTAGSPGEPAHFPPARDHAAQA
jgi:hypothetical protein